MAKLKRRCTRSHTTTKLNPTNPLFLVQRDTDTSPSQQHTTPPSWTNRGNLRPQKGVPLWQKGVPLWQEGAYLGRGEGGAALRWASVGGGGGAAGGGRQRPSEVDVRLGGGQGGGSKSCGRDPTSLSKTRQIPTNLTKANNAKCLEVLGNVTGKSGPHWARLGVVTRRNKTT